jgi:hypothetical protein
MFDKNNAPGFPRGSVWLQTRSGENPVLENMTYETGRHHPDKRLRDALLSVLRNNTKRAGETLPAREETKHA